MNRRLLFRHVTVFFYFENRARVFDNGPVWLFASEPVNPRLQTKFWLWMPIPCMDWMDGWLYEWWKWAMEKQNGYPLKRMAHTRHQFPKCPTNGWFGVGGGKKKNACTQTCQKSSPLTVTQQPPTDAERPFAEYHTKQFSRVCLLFSAFTPARYCEAARHGKAYKDRCIHVTD